MTWRYALRSKYDFEPEVRIPKGIEFKNQGNTFFKVGDLENAKKLYGQCIHYLEDEKTEEAKATMIAVFQNMSLIHFKQKNFEAAKDEATKAIEKDPQAVIFYFKKIGKSFL